MSSGEYASLSVGNYLLKSSEFSSVSLYRIFNAGTPSFQELELHVAHVEAR